MNPGLNMASGDKKSGFLKAVAHEKNERVARDSLHHIVTFQHSLDKEIKKIEHNAAHGKETDQGLTKKMLKVKDHYQQIKLGFTATDDNSLRHAFSAYADAVQDLMAHLYRRRPS